MGGGLVLVLMVLWVVVVGRRRGGLFASWGWSGGELDERVWLAGLLLYE